MQGKENDFSNYNLAALAAMADLCHVFHQMTFCAETKRKLWEQQRLINLAIEDLMGDLQEEVGLAKPG